jgi:hypothetical protein
MRRPFALVFIAALLVVVLLVPFVAPVGIAWAALGLDEPAAPVRRAAVEPDGPPSSPSAELVSLLLFRGPPVAGFPIEQRTEKPTREVSPWKMGDAGDGGAGSARS